MTYIEVADYAAVRGWRAAAAREHVSLTDLPGTTWYVVRGVGCAGLQVKGGRARIRGVYVDPIFRGTGVGTALGERLIADAIAEGCTLIDAYTTQPHWYDARGFSREGTNPFGNEHVVRRL